MRKRNYRALEFFRLPVRWDQDERRLRGRFGLRGIAMYVELLQEIFGEGYALRWSEDDQSDFAQAHGIEEADLAALVAFAAERGLFDAGLLARGILTGAGVQETWREVARACRWKVADIEPGLAVKSPGLSSEDTAQSSEDRDQSSGDNGLSSASRTYLQNKRIQGQDGRLGEALAALAASFPERREALEEGEKVV
jgi:hypothetical protein